MIQYSYAANTLGLYEFLLSAQPEIGVPFNLWKCFNYEAIFTKTAGTNPYPEPSAIDHTWIKECSIVKEISPCTKAVFGGPKALTPGGTLRGTLILAELYTLAGSIWVWKINIVRADGFWCTPNPQNQFTSVLFKIRSTANKKSVGRLVFRLSFLHFHVGAKEAVRCDILRTTSTRAPVFGRLRTCGGLV